MPAKKVKAKRTCKLIEENWFKGIFWIRMKMAFHDKLYFQRFTRRLKGLLPFLNCKFKVDLLLSSVLFVGYEQSSKAGVSQHVRVRNMFKSN